MAGQNTKVGGEQGMTVFRDARHIITAPVADLPRPELVAAMTGEAAATGPRERARAVAGGGPPALVVEDLTGADGTYG